MKFTACYAACTLERVDGFWCAMMTRSVNLRIQPFVAACWMRY